MNITIDAIDDDHRRLIEDVTNDILTEVNSGNTRFDGGDNEARFPEVPKYKQLIVRRNHDILCLPT